MPQIDRAELLVLGCPAVATARRVHRTGGPGEVIAYLVLSLIHI